MRSRTILAGLTLGLALACGWDVTPPPGEAPSDPGGAAAQVPATDEVGATASGPVRAPPAEAQVLGLYTALLDGGCDPVAAHIDSPVVARVLRNTPYAAAGRAFTSPDLDALFRADGSWYQPQGQGLALDEPDRACVAALRDHEDRLRRVVCVDPATQVALTSSLEVFLWHAEQGFSGAFREVKGTRRIPVDPGVGLCHGGEAPDDREFTVTRWSATLAPVADAAAAREWVHTEMLMMGNLTDAERRARFEAEVDGWFAEGAVRGFRIEVDGDDYMGAGGEYFGFTELLRCVGPGRFMDSRWVCAGYSLP